MDSNRLWSPAFTNYGISSGILYMTQYVLVAALPIVITSELAGSDRRFLHSVKGKTRAFTGEATGACSASMGGIPDPATVCLRQRGRFTAGRYY